jgi:hypothetical protein
MIQRVAEKLEQIHFNAILNWTEFEEYFHKTFQIGKTHR